ncbi:MAG: right-handed parallel beta-helix repeat-containing protein [Candidatus Thorarchaeota archaeon]|jgi:parallel beta-helix repeat protein
MQKKPFMIIILAILLAQPLVVVSSISTTFVTSTLSPVESVTVAQEHGTRLEGTDLANHVPILINGTADFDVQGWPGDGTEGNPFVIAGLNITYDYWDYLITIMNVDDYFVIEDCFLHQFSGEWGIRLENVTHATIQYVTIISESGGFDVVTSDGVDLSHVHVESSYDVGLWANHVPNLEVSHSLFNSTNAGAAWVNGSNSAEISNSVFDSDVPYTDLQVRYSNDVTMYDVEFHASSIELYVRNCVNFYANGIIATHGEDEGIWLYQCNDSRIENAEVMTNWNALYVNQCFNISISDSEFTNIVGSQCLQIVSSSEISFNQILVNDTNSMAMQVTGSDNITIVDSTFSNIPGECIWIQTTPDVNIISNTFGNIDDTVIGLDSSSHRANVSYNSMSDFPFNPGMYVANSDNGTFGHNDLTNAGLGFYSISSSRWQIHDNVMMGGDTGIEIESGAQSDIWNNNISKTANYGFYALGHGTIELWENTIIDTETGMYLENCDYQYVRDNRITNSVTGMYLETTANSTINDNIISDCEENGIYLLEVVTTEFDGNNISRCGVAGFYYYDGFYNSYTNNNLEECGFNFLEFPSSVAKFNHSFSGNLINGLPLFYAINQSSLAIDGNNYGQIILINCTDSSVTGGNFVSCTSAVQINFGSEISITGISGENLYMSAYAQLAENITIQDSTFIAGNHQNGIFVWNSPRFWIENCTFSGMGGDWLSAPTALRLFSSDYYTVIDCEFTDLPGYGIAAGDTGFSSGVWGEIIDCTFTNNTRAITSYNAQWLNITNNDFKWCDYGIYSDISDYWRVEWNEIQDCDVGIYKYISYDWLTANNTVRWNRIGMESEGAFTEGIVADNVFALNYEANGLDDNLRYWDDSVDTGNYWDDYGGSGVYNIGGGGGAQDRYPMQYVVSAPIINSPMDMWMAEGSDDNTIFWLPYDDALRDWTVTVDGEAWDSGIWNFNNVTVNFDALAYGTHTVLITVWDVDSSYVNDTVIVHVYDNTPPEIDAPGDQVLFEGVEMTVEWEVSDLNPTDYVVTVDETEFDTGTWATGFLEIDFDGVAAGYHNVTVTIYDVDGNMASDFIIILVIDDDVSPTIDSPEDIEYVEETTGNSIAWVPEDDHPDSYSVSYNSTVVESGDWGGSRITVDVDGLSVGSHVFTITVYDRSGNSATDSVNVTVTPIIPIEPPVPPVDWVLLLIIGGAIGAVVVVIVIVYFLKKRPAS